MERQEKGGVRGDLSDTKEGRAPPMVITCISVNALFIITISFKQRDSESLKTHRDGWSGHSALLRGAREPEGGSLSSRPAEGACGL